MANEESGTEPDYRYTLANERTFLAWMRTSLALIAGGIALEALATGLNPRWLATVAGMIATALGAVLAALALRHWHRVQLAMRKGEPLPVQRLEVVLTVGVVIVAAAVSIGIAL